MTLSEKSPAIRSLTVVVKPRSTVNQAFATPYTQILKLTQRASELCLTCL